MKASSILIVEDEFVIAKDIETSLENMGYIVCAIVPSGEEAIAKAEKEKPDLVLMDIILKGAIDGIEAARQIWSQLNIPIVYLTAYADENTLERAKITEPYGYIIKPFNDKELNTAIQIALYKHKMEKKLKESEEQYKFLTENMADIVWTLDLNLQTTYVSPSIKKVLGFTPEERNQHSIEEAVTPESLQEIQKRFMEELQRDKEDGAELDRSVIIEVEYYRKDGSTVWMENRVQAIRDSKNAIVGMMGVSRDITERKKAEATIRKSEEKYRSLFENAPIGIAIVDKERNILDFNDAMLRLHGYSQEDRLAIGRTSEYYYNPEDREKVAAQLLKNGFANELDVKFKRKDGTPYDALLSMQPIEIGGKTLWHAMIQDVSEHKRSEEVLRESEEKFKLLAEHSADIIYKINLESEQYTYASPSVETLFGYSPEEILSLKAKDTLTAESYGKQREKLINAVAGGRRSPEIMEIEVVHKDGHILPVEIHAKFISDERGNPVEILGVARDITERKQAEEERERLEAQLQQASKMEAIGTLAGGIAHDFNNLLMAMQGNASLVLMDKDSSHPDYERLKNIEEYIRDAANLTKQLLGFARGGKYEVRPTNLNTLLQKTSKMFGRTKKEITIHQKYQEDLWTVEADPGQIEQVLLNLYVNAWQAMPGDGGELYLETQNTIIDEHYSKPYDVKPGKYVKISITDTGSGMDEATRKRIFDPFFTTKEMGRGTGLGLASVYGIVKSHGGFIDVYSEKGHGTIFKIHLPAIEADSIAPVVEPDKAIEMARGKETILLVDDEDMIIEVEAELLQEMGYHVLIAKSGREAIEIVSKAHSPGPASSAPDLVILDMIMPEMSGRETYDRLKEISPGIRVLLSSGYSVDGQATEILDRGCNGFIQKPFKVKELSQKLREILDEK